MKTYFLVGIAMLLLGSAVLGYDHYSYTTTESVLQIGPLSATAERTHTVMLPPILGWLLVGGGALVLAFAALSKKS